MTNIAVILTVFNRKETTLHGLQSLYSAIRYLGEGYHFDVYMTDDGSTDGTGDAVKSAFPDVIILQGDGDLYWCGGMRKAWQTAIDAKIKYDYYLWFNDDTILYEDALQELLQESKKHANKCNIVGATQSINHLEVSYGGYLKNKLVVPHGQGVNVDYFNGNIVLVPAYVCRMLGNLDVHFRHSHGDTDYGLRAKESGLKNYVVGKFLGECNRHDNLKPCWDPQVPFKKRWKNLYHPTGYPPCEAFYFERKHKGLLTAIVHKMSLYARVLFPNVWCKAGRARI